VARQDTVELEGRVVEVLPNTIFRVELSNGHRLLAYVANGMRTPANPILPGDEVVLEVSPYDLSKGRITVRRE
jgi:translation initiation factor IF-1